MRSTSTRVPTMNGAASMKERAQITSNPSSSKSARTESRTRSSSWKTRTRIRRTVTCPALHTGGEESWTQPATVAGAASIQARSRQCRAEFNKPGERKPVRREPPLRRSPDRRLLRRSVGSISATAIRNRDHGDARDERDRLPTTHHAAETRQDFRRERAHVKNEGVNVVGRDEDQCLLQRTDRARVVAEYGQSGDDATPKRLRRNHDTDPI